MRAGVPGGFVILIPAYNEEGRIGRVLDDIAALHPGVERVVIVDGATDGTCREARGHGATVLDLGVNLGYGAALQAGYMYALMRGYGRAVQMDADGQHPPEYIGALVGGLDEPGVDVVVGSRFLEPTGYAMPWPRRVTVGFMRLMVRLLGGMEVSDPTSGYQALSARAMVFYSSDAYPDDFPDADVFIMLSRVGLGVREVPCAMRPSTKAETMHSGLRAVYYVFKMCLSVLVVALRSYGSAREAMEREGGAR